MGISTSSGIKSEFWPNGGSTNNNVTTKNFKVVIEGIKQPYPLQSESWENIALQYPNVLNGESPYKWRWNGYKDKIDMEQTKCMETKI